MDEAEKPLTADAAWDALSDALDLWNADGRTEWKGYLLARHRPLIEAEARAAVLTEAIQRVEAAWTAHGAIGQSTVLAILRDLAGDGAALSCNPTTTHRYDRIADNLLRCRRCGHERAG